LNRDLPSTWPRWRPGLCNGCQANCCTLPVEASPADLVRMGLLTEDEARGSLKKAARALMKSGHVRIFRAKTNFFTLTQRPNGDCLYLDAERRCTIYDKRPAVCRRFPEIGPRPGYCPAQPRAT
jgi:Fe-S-cluster containining protein